MELSGLYDWEIETISGAVYRKGGDKRWQEIDATSVLRVSLIPNARNLAPVHVYCSPDNAFVGWFGKGFLKQQDEFRLSEYAQCIETEQQRVWVLSDGKTIITHPDFELRV